MNDKERFALAERVQKRIQEEQSHFWLTKRRDEINKKLEVKKENHRFWTINENIKTNKQILRIYFFNNPDNLFSGLQLWFLHAWFDIWRIGITSSLAGGNGKIRPQKMLKCQMNVDGVKMKYFISLLNSLLL